ncbi:hypothetical protein [uncultured Pseudoteredinibacter sp.]|uniref:hypothetical protein n=1 Tax=uncultured Pseudoteredinibacter sp. TaxID=1641701 RepID=UPI0026096A43|nr:hypothetical protein [uncultured Pseudoteredinibacter sp.]
MTVEDIFNEVKAGLYDRGGNPLFVSFLLAWLIVNHKIGLLLLSDESFTSKIEFIDCYYQKVFIETCDVVSPVYLNVFLSNIALPLVFAYLYLLLSPIFSGWISHYAAKKKTSISNRIIKLKEVELVPLSDLLKIKKIAEELEGDVERLNTQNAALGSQQTDSSNKILGLQEQLRLAQELSIDRPETRRLVDPKVLKEMINGHSVGAYKLRDVLLTEPDISSAKGTVHFLEHYINLLYLRSLLVGFDLKNVNDTFYIFIYGAGFERDYIYLLSIIARSSSGVVQASIRFANEYLKEMSVDKVDGLINRLKDKELVREVPISDGPTTSRGVKLTDAGREYLESVMHESGYPV